MRKRAVARAREEKACGFLNMVITLEAVSSGSSASGEEQRAGGGDQAPPDRGRIFAIAKTCASVASCSNVSFGSECSSILSSCSTLVDDKAMRATAPVAAPSKKGQTSSGEAPELVMLHAATFPPILESSLSTSSDIPSLQQTRRCRGIAVKSNSLPIIPTIKTKELRFPMHSECSLISSSGLNELMAKDLDSASDVLLIFDTRTFIDYNKNHIKNAFHVCLPSTLLKRKNFNLLRLVGNLPLPDRDIVADYLLNDNPEQNLTIVIYDNVTNQTDASISLSCFGVSSKILDHERGDQTKPKVYILSDGFDSFHKQYASEVEAGKVLLSPTTSMPLDPSNIDSSAQTTPRHPYRSKSQSSSPFAQPPPLSHPRTLSDSPMSTSSPLSALFGFQLPTQSSHHPPAFRLPQIEHDITDLDSYVKAVEVNENQRYSQSQNDCEDRLQCYKFPLSAGEVEGSLGTSGNEPARTPLVSSSKLTFQKKYDSLFQHFESKEINRIIPTWFTQLMSIPKLQFIAKFQRLEMLERKRLNKLLSSSSRSTIISQQSTENLAANPEQDSDDEPEEQHQTITISSGVEFGAKNRYKDIFPYEHTRVRLSHGNLLNQSGENAVFDENDEDDVWNSYINANYLVNPFEHYQQNADVPRFHPVRYIATQAPLKETIGDFYTCVLNNNVPLILTLTDEYENGVEKCCKFWVNGVYNNITVQLIDEFSTLKNGQPSDLNVNYEDNILKSNFFKHLNLSDHVKDEETDIIIRRIRLTYSGGKTFDLLQLQIKDWPDLGTLRKPDEILKIINLKNFIIDSLFQKKLYRPEYTPTILVHCSAGCGRTGTLCTVDSVLSNLQKFDRLENNMIVPKCSVYSFELSPITTDSANGAILSDSPKKINIDLFDPIVTTVNQFRRQRISMVQNINQFLFVYDCLLEFFTLNLKTFTGSDKVMNDWEKMTDMSSKTKILQDFILQKSNEK